MQAAFITSFFIKDFCKIYDVAKTYYNSIPQKEQDVINSLDIRGRNKIWKKKINELVYGLYGLSEEEIEIVEGK